MAGSDVRRLLTAPAFWLVVGLFAIASGVAFLTALNAFLDQSSRALAVPPSQPININQLLIRPFLLQVGLAALLLLPPVTARAYTSERRTGDLRIVFATFVATLASYVIMLLPSMALVALLFVYGSPEWGPLASGYLGLLLIGAAFLSAGLFVSSLATSSAAAGLATFAISLLLAAATWVARSGGSGARPMFRYFAAGNALDDFAKGVVDTGHLVACLTIIALGVFATSYLLQPPRSET